MNCDDDLWRYGEVDGYQWEAKVYDLPSMFGIDGGRVSKLFIYAPEETDRHYDTVHECPAYVIYEYDRGLQLDESPPGLLQKVLEAATASQR